MLLHPSHSSEVIFLILTSSYIRKPKSHCLDMYNALITFAGIVFRSHISFIISKEMRLTIQPDKETFHDTISGNVILRNAGCASTDKPLLGSVTLRVVVTLDSHTGLFSRKRVTLCEEKVDMAFYPNVCSVFSFNRVDIGRRLAVTLPDSYSGYGIRVVYTIIAKCVSFFSSTTEKLNVQVKGCNQLTETPAELYINKNDINDFDGLLCSSNIDFVPEVHATCRVRSSSVNIADGISGVLTVEQCNMAIQSISVGIVQNEQLKIRNTPHELHVVRDTKEISCGDCYRNTEIPFIFYPNPEGVSNDWEADYSRILFSLRIKVLFCNQFYCIKYLPVHFSW